ncbi:MAG: CopD family protein [Dehalococcoidia bacterium]
MDDTLRIIAVWTHILGIALFVGPQFFLAFAWGPAARTIKDQHTRLDLTRMLTQRFAWIGGMGIILIVVAGTYLIATWRDHYGVPDDAEFTALRYGVIFIVKMTVLMVMLAIVGAHMFFVGPRLVNAMDAHINHGGLEENVRSARMLSMAFSIAGLLLALALMVLGVMMNTTTFSFQDA